jgi:hypothetical protein
MEYRRLDGTNTWHWREECAAWPGEAYAASARRPYYGELCNECRALESSPARRPVPPGGPDTDDAAA